MLYIWCSPGLPQADLLNSMLGEYLQASAAQLSSFRATRGNVRAMPWTSKAAGSGFSSQQLSATEGHMRLDPAMSPRHFYAQWVFLWTCAVETMPRSRFESSPSHALRHINVATFAPQGEHENFKLSASRIQVAYEQTISVKVQTMLRTTESLTERDLTMVTVSGRLLHEGLIPQGM